jgi:hypothetical protein
LCWLRLSPARAGAASPSAICRSKWSCSSSSRCCNGFCILQLPLPRRAISGYLSPLRKQTAALSRLHLAVFSLLLLVPHPGEPPPPMLLPLPPIATAPRAAADGSHRPTPCRRHRKLARHLCCANLANLLQATSSRGRRRSRRSPHLCATREGGRGAARAEASRSARLLLSRREAWWRRGRISSPRFVRWRRHLLPRPPPPPSVCAAAAAADRAGATFVPKSGLPISIAPRARRRAATVDGKVAAAAVVLLPGAEGVKTGATAGSSVRRLLGAAESSARRLPSRAGGNCRSRCARGMR